MTDMVVSGRLYEKPTTYLLLGVRGSIGERSHIWIRKAIIRAPIEGIPDGTRVVMSGPSMVNFNEHEVFKRVYSIERLSKQ